MNPMIILEGPDCTGKSTLAAALRDQAGMTPWHMTWNKLMDPWLVDYMIQETKCAINVGNQNGFVFDRHWPSEVVYGSIFNRPDRSRRLNDIRELIRNSFFPVIYVFCLPKDVVRWKDLYLFNIDPSHDYDMVNMKKVFYTYQDLYEGFVLRPGELKTRHDMFFSPIDIQVKRITALLKNVL